MRSSQKLVLNYIRTKFKLLSALSKRKAAKKAFILFCTPLYRNRKSLPKVFEQAERIRLQFTNHSIAGYRWNSKAEKTILIIHGFESSVINFDRYIKPLIKKGYSILAFDAPAHGRSSGNTINVLLYKDLLNLINKAYGPVNNFLAHSLGGLALCLTLEEWKHDETYKVVLIAPAVETNTAINTFFKVLKLNDKVRDEFDKIIEQKGGKPVSWYSIARAAQNIKAKVLFFQDKDDNMTPYSDVEPIINSNHTNFEFIITENLGHRRIYRDNKVSKAIIDFF